MGSPGIGVVAALDLSALLPGDERRRIANGGKTPEVLPHVAADGVGPVYGEGQIEALVEDRQQHITPHRHCGSGERDRVGLVVELVVELAEDLFDGVLTGDHARDRSELVHHDRHVDAPLGEGVHQRRNLEHLADDHGLFGDVGDRRRRTLLAGEEEVAKGDETDDLLPVLGDREAGVRAGGELGERIGDRSRRVDRDEATPRRHDLA